MNLVLDEIRITGNELTVKGDPFSVSVEEPGRMTVFISTSSLAAFLEHLSPAGLRKFEVSASHGKLYVDAVKTVLVDLKAKAVCSVRVVDRKLLYVDLETVVVAGAGIKTLLQSQLDKINPIIDLDDLPLKAFVDSVTLDERGITLTGRVAP